MAQYGGGEKTMSTQNDEITIKVGVDASDAKKGAKEAESAISKMSSTIMSKLGLLGAAATAALSVFWRVCFAS